MSSARILIACIGNMFLGDDAFGVEVARRLAARALPDGVRVVDFGIRGLDLVYALFDGYEAVVFVDAMPRGGLPGTLYVLQPDVVDADAGTPTIGHGLDPASVLRLAASMGATVERILVVGCEPEPFDENAERNGRLSPRVQRAVAQAVVMVESLVERLLRGEDVVNYGNEQLSRAGG